ncbi:HAMP domain-containing sensor histidine kinase [Novosphingobium sp. JCM 18896]|uniref:sensor histidine kinase n=1 Tax=Novosphingobium sp. JCM 18896 TaxID=2989731 RepID=UPI0029CA9998|nr:HAMP domain-containing sensor histidine kinase [Novosphingobium sp. JCM 18896]
MSGGLPAPLRAVSDGADMLVSADKAIAALQLRCGGDLPGMIAVPALLEVVRKARRYGLKLARTIQAQDGASAITAWVEVEPLPGDDAGCEILLRNWHAAPLAAEDPAEADERRGEIDRHVAELTARLDAGQRVLTVEAEAPDLVALAAAMEAGFGRPWTDFITIAGNSHSQPLHWRLLDGADVEVPGSPRRWRASLFPQAGPGREPAGFELCLVSPELPALPPEPDAGKSAARHRLLGRDVAPVLRQPIARIIANAETIHSRLAGPISDDYANYAADIASAGQHLLALIEDLTDLEVVEADDFSTAPDRIDLADVARQAAGILGVRAREKRIALDAPRPGESLPAVAEFRRVLQVLINLVTNAIRYSPEDSQVWIRLEDSIDAGPGRVRVVVCDQGPGLSEADQGRVFEKFERLGRSGDGGSGLGLYISRRLARAMGGDLSVESASGQGARFILDLPAASQD